MNQEVREKLQIAGKTILERIDLDEHQKVEKLAQEAKDNGEQFAQYAFKKILLEYIIQRNGPVFADFIQRLKICKI